MNWPDVSTDQLIRECASARRAGAWEEFMRRYHPVILAAAARVSRRWGSGGAGEIDDIVQEIYLKLCARQARLLTEFRSPEQEAVFGYVKAIATNAARDYFRHKMAGKRGAAQTVPLAPKIADQAAQEDDLELQTILRQLQTMVDAATRSPQGERDRSIFYFYYRDGMSAAAIAALPGIGLGAKGVEAVIHRLTRAVREVVEQGKDAGRRP